MSHLQLQPDDPPPGFLRTADLLGALSLAGDLAMGVPAEHGARSCYLGMHIAERLQLPPDQQTGLYYAEFLMDAGCTAWTSQLATFFMSDEIAARRELFWHTDIGNPIEVVRWLKDYLAAGQPTHVRARQFLAFALHGKEDILEGMQNTCEVAGRFALRMGMPEVVQSALLSVFEQWDGGGPTGMRGDMVPIISRIVYTTSFLEMFHHIGGRAAAIRLAQERKGRAFDPSVVEAFLSIASEDAFWDSLEHESLWATVLAMEPQSPYRFLNVEKLEDVALSFADYTDLKSFYSTGHSRRVGDLAERIAWRMRLSVAEVATIRRAALMHDIGLVAVPSFTLQKPYEQFTPVEWELLRLHPYHAERILSHVPALAPAVPLVAAHHERLDGHGYYRGLSGSQIPLGARIIAVADRFDELSHDTPGQPALDPEEALGQINNEVGHSLCPTAFAALMRELHAGELTAPAKRKSHPHEWPADLTDREVEILRLLTKGLSRRAMGEQLFLSEHTVRHHLEHIYNKLGVTTRVGATLFAVEHDLLY